MPLNFISSVDFFLHGYPINEDDTLYIIVDGDKCQKAQHTLYQGTWRIKYKAGIVEAEGQYCKTCRQAQIRRNLYAGLYQEHGKPCCKTVLKGLEDVVFEEPQPNYPDYLDTEFKERASESKLRKLGYSVSSTSGTSDKHRQALLKDAIGIGAVSRGYVISYLSHMIKINGQKASNEYACRKWQADLDFVLKL